jgi:hypothetical protein
MMMRVPTIALLTVLPTAQHLLSQTSVQSTPQTSSSVSMEQTVAFIDDTLRQQGSFSVQMPPVFEFNSIIESQKLRRTDECELGYESAYTTNKHHITTQKLLLRAEDPRAVSVEPNPNSTTAEWFVRLNVEDNQGFYLDGKHWHFDLKELMGENHHMTLGQFLSKDLAERVAKAYIHALVLCHKPEAPSPF